MDNPLLLPEEIDDVLEGGGYDAWRDEIEDPDPGGEEGGSSLMTLLEDDDAGVTE